MRICLDHVMRMLTGDRLGDLAVTGQGRPWHHLRYERTAWIREQIDHMDGAAGVVRRPWPSASPAGLSHLVGRLLIRGPRR
ncbi:hypothetical protein ABZW49_31190 [Nonomuraea wenchangensis]